MNLVGQGIHLEGRTRLAVFGYVQPWRREHEWSQAQRTERDKLIGNLYGDSSESRTGRFRIREPASRTGRERPDFEDRNNLLIKLPKGDGDSGERLGRPIGGANWLRERFSNAVHKESDDLPRGRRKLGLARNSRRS